MTFDDELDRALATLTTRLRDECDRQTREAVAALTAAARAERERAVTDARTDAETTLASRLASAAGDAETRVRAAEERAREEGRQIGREEGRFEGLEQGRAEAAHQIKAEPVRPDAGADRLADAIRALDRARSLSEILDTLASCAGREAARAAVLLAEDGRFTGWRFIGFDDTFASPRAIQISATDAHIVADAARSGILAGAARDTDGARRAPAFARLPAGAECVAIPVAISGHVVAVLYADKGSTPDAERLEGEGTPQWRGRLDVLARHAARCLESVVAVKALHIVDEPRASAPQAPAASEARDERGVATRYARVLLSEIRVYHEADVIAGRRDRNLTTRLSGEIARARLLYEQRIPPHVAERGDIFHNELVRALADGDAALLEARA